MERTPKTIEPLVNEKYKPIQWSDETFSYPGMIRIRTIGDGSCFFHAIINGFFVPYRAGELDGKPISRKEFISLFRREAAKKLGERVVPNDPNSPKHYDTISRGKLRQHSADYPPWSLENMQKELQSNSPVDNLYLEFISNQLDKDIYILNGIEEDVYITGNDDDILYKNRNSVVIMYVPGHYETVGVVDEKGEIHTYFSPDSPFIKAIRSRMAKRRTVLNYSTHLP
jgi:hypothetical protein